jgi:RNA polymerase sigma-70 factor, ECF subfamily
MVEHIGVIGLDPALDAQARVERLVVEHEVRLARFVRRFTGDGDAALDVVQEVFFAAYRMLRSDPTRPLSAGWLYKSAANRAISYLRRRKRGGERSEEDVAAAFRVDERSVVALDLQNALRRLAPEQLACVLLTTYAGYTSHEAAALLGIRPEAVRQRVSRGLRAMRATLGERG